MCNKEVFLKIVIIDEKIIGKHAGQHNFTTTHDLIINIITAVIERAATVLVIELGWSI